MTTGKTALFLTIALGLAACSDDSSGPSDSGTADLALDLSRTDASTADSLPETGSPDSASDAAAQDLTAPDATVPDATAPDATSPDAATPDSAVPDTGADQALPEGPCAPGATSEVLVAEAMVACLTATATSNQCAAASLCGPGWHLCTASEYQAQFAAAAPPLSESCWLAGCIRDGGDAFAPVDGSCSSCSGATGSEEEVGWGCIANITLTADELQVGLRASTSCSLVGVNASANEAYWQPWTTNQLLPGAVCCN